MTTAPNFKLADQDGVVHSLEDYAGRWLVLYFYPKDDTPGCTKEACSFRDGRHELESLGAVVVGVSTDSVSSHRKFADKYHLNFPLLSDPDHQVIEAYDSWQPKKIMGKEFLGTQRNTYLINPAGMIIREYKGVNPAQHSDQLIADLRRLIVT